MRTARIRADSTLYFAVLSLLIKRGLRRMAQRTFRSLCTLTVDSSSERRVFVSRREFDHFRARVPCLRRLNDVLRLRCELTRGVFEILLSRKSREKIFLPLPLPPFLRLVALFNSRSGFFLARRFVTRAARHSFSSSWRPRPLHSYSRAREAGRTSGEKRREEIRKVSVDEGY